MLLLLVIIMVTPWWCHYSWAVLLCRYYRVWLGSKSSTICCVYRSGE